METAKTIFRAIIAIGIGAGVITCGLILFYWLCAAAGTLAARLLGETTQSPAGFGVSVVVCLIIFLAACYFVGRWLMRLGGS